MLRRALIPRRKWRQFSLQRRVLLLLSLFLSPLKKFPRLLSLTNARSTAGTSGFERQPLQTRYKQLEDLLVLCVVAAYEFSV